MTQRDWWIAAGVSALLAIAVLLWLTPSGLNQAPAVTLKTLQGDEIPLTELRGRPVLVTFWATTCSSCMKEIPHLIELHEAYHERGLAIFGVAMSYDPPNQVVEFTRARDLPYQIALDIRGEVAKAFDNVTLTPTTFLIAPDGRVVVHRIGLFDAEAMHERIGHMIDNRQAG